MILDFFVKIVPVGYTAAMRTGFLSLILLASAANAGAGEPTQSRAKTTVTKEVRQSARKLAHAWIDTASASTLDALSNRSIAFAGMVPGVYVKLDGRMMRADRSLVDSGLTIIKSSDNHADAQAIRNTVYILMEVAEGRVFR